MPEQRKVQRLSQSQPTIEGAGVHLHRALGFAEVPIFDPFLLLDDFRGDHPEQYLAGFPWHPHRGIETITYVLAGEVDHGDSMGNQGVIGGGDVQWMTAGSGIIHQEMPRGDRQGRMYGFQLWANLPASHKLMAPRYREIKGAQIPEVTMEGGAQVKVISGRVGETVGPVRDIITAPEYLDVTIPPATTFEHPTRSGHTVFAYVIAGAGRFDSERTAGRNRDLLLFTEGEGVRIEAEAEGVRFLLISGQPLAEPVAWRGPIVMNTQEELETAFREYREGTFIKQTAE
ncbi:MAG TPA: pirin family protein [Desulfurivibrionaceae bacterium]|nr:pirin family protein [Desulfurivibrionaceae bacterium]